MEPNNNNNSSSISSSSTSNTEGNISGNIISNEYADSFTNGTLHQLLPTITTATHTRTTELDVVVATIWLVLLTYALVTNIIVVIGILRSQALLKTTSYLLIVSLAFCDICMVVISIVHIVPATIWHERFLRKISWRNIAMLFFYDFFWYTGVLKLAVMALNRFVAIVLPNQYNRLFVRRRTFQIIAALYAIGFAVSVPTLFPCCQMVWDGGAYMTDFVRSPSDYMHVDFAVNSVSLVTMIVCYVIILWRVRESRQALSRYKERRKSSFLVVSVGGAGSGEQDGDSRSHRNSAAQTTTNMMAFNPAASLQYHLHAAQHLVMPRPSMSKREIRLLVQFFVVSIVFLSTWVAWQLLLSYTTSKIVCAMFTSLFFINNAINPTVYFIFNSSLRREIRKMFCGPKGIDPAARRYGHRKPIIPGRRHRRHPAVNRSRQQARNRNPSGGSSLRTSSVRKLLGKNSNVPPTRRANSSPQTQQQILMISVPPVPPSPVDESLASSGVGAETVHRILRSSGANIPQHCAVSSMGSNESLKAEVNQEKEERDSFIHSAEGDNDNVRAEGDMQILIPHQHKYDQNRSEISPISLSVVSDPSMQQDCKQPFLQQEQKKRSQASKPFKQPPNRTTSLISQCFDPNNSPLSLDIDIDGDSSDSSSELVASGNNKKEQVFFDYSRIPPDATTAAPAGSRTETRSSVYGGSSFERDSGNGHSTISSIGGGGAAAACRSVNSQQRQYYGHSVVHQFPLVSIDNCNEPTLTDAAIETIAL